MQYNKISQDELTGLNNRREFRHYLDGVFVSPNTETIFVCMIDVDYFKNINDTYGHVEGDRALILVSKILKKVCSYHNKRLFLARYGGDEFIIAGTNPEEGILEDIKNEVERVSTEENDKSGKPYRVSLSVGYTWGKPSAFGTAASLISEADKNMYEVKKIRKQTVIG